MKHTENATTVVVGSCTATCIAKTGPVYTFELVYPRIIHGELMTHRVFSRNAMSSRATPAMTLISDVLEHPYIPKYILGNKSGMVGEDTLTEEQKQQFLGEYNHLIGYTCQKALDMAKLGVHKNLINRLIEPFSFMKTIVTATDWDNFFKLRLAPDAEPNMQDLAQVIRRSMDIADDLAFKKESPMYEDCDYCNYTYYHLPYIREDELSQDTLKLMMVSAARCARVSYLTHDGKVPTFEEDLKLFFRLSEGGHYSPMEHPCVVSYHTEGHRYYNLDGAKSLRYILCENLEE